ncbi:MAG: hypothetical protein HND48_21755 [Chloroflexi bacterium]|nr:hypothetical protein [Chloroflexota bacterium]
MAQAYIDGLLGAIGHYDSQRDTDYVTNFGRDDLRMYNRYEIAWHANVLARIANNADLRAVSDAVRQGADLNRSYLLLTGEWREDTSPPRGGQYLGMDLSAGAVVRGSGLTANQLDRLFYLTNQQALNAILFQLLRQPEDFSASSYGTIQRALRQTREQAPMPKRWTMHPYLIVWNDADRDIPERASMGAIMRDHPRFDELLDMEDHRRAQYVTPLERTTKLYVWFLPEFERITRYLLSVPGLGDQIRTELGTTPTPETLLALLDRLWQRSAAEGHSQRDLDAFTGAQTDITGAIGRDITSAEQAARPAVPVRHHPRPPRDRRPRPAPTGCLRQRFQRDELRRPQPRDRVSRPLSSGHPAGQPDRTPPANARADPLDRAELARCVRAAGAYRGGAGHRNPRTALRHHHRPVRLRQTGAGVHRRGRRCRTASSGAAQHRRQHSAGGECQQRTSARADRPLGSRHRRGTAPNRVQHDTKPHPGSCASALPANWA